MFFSDETYRSVLVAAIQEQGGADTTADVIKNTVDALIAADRRVVSYQIEDD